MTLSDVAELTLLSWDTVKAIVKAHLAKDYGKPLLKGVRYLGIDEIHLGKKSRFYTIVIDLEDGRILWVKPGRGGAALRGFWRRLRLAKAQIRAVATDMSAAYWSAMLEHLPEAALVFDKFHVIKLMNERLDDLRRQMVREAEGPLKLRIKGTRFLLLRNPENLQEDQIPKLDRALQLNEPLLLGWYLKEELRELWNQPSRQQMDAFLKDWCQQADQTAIGQLMQMAKTLRTHASGNHVIWQPFLMSSNSGNGEGKLWHPHERAGAGPVQLVGFWNWSALLLLAGFFFVKRNGGKD